MCLPRFHRYGTLANGLKDGIDIRLGSIVADVHYTAPAPITTVFSQPQQGENANGNTAKEESGVQVTLSDGSIVEGDAVLVTVPLGVLKKSTFMLPLMIFIFIHFIFL
jgi:Flavin containing amine oxidoreductase